MSDEKPLSAASFWLGKCLDCAHPPHPVRTCHEIVANGDPSNGPAYCRCSAEMEAMEIALLDAERSARVPVPADGLDVERLAEALMQVTREVLYRGDEEGHRWRMKTAATIAAEYERLSPARSAPITESALAEALGDLFPHYQREKWPFTAEQAATAILANLRERRG